MAPPSPPRYSTSIVDAASRREASGPDVSLYMSLALFNELQDSPWQERIEDGYLRFLTGAFRPPKPKHQLPREDMTIVAARVDPQMRAAVENYARLHAATSGGPRPRSKSPSPGSCTHLPPLQESWSWRTEGPGRVSRRRRLRGRGEHSGTWRA